MHGSVTWNNYYGYKVGCSLYGLEAVLCKCVIFLDSWIVNDLCRAQRWKLFFFCWVFLAVLCQYTTVFCRCCPCSSVGVAHVVTSHFIAVLPVERRVWSWRCLVCVTQSHAVLCGSKTFPLDWSLKTRVRFVTSSSMSWCGLIRGFEESRGCAAFTACTPLATADQLQVTPATGNS